MKKHANLSIFVPHDGCPQQCLFCNQNRIAGASHTPSPAEVSALCERFLPARDRAGFTEIAFFGGSFTAIDRAVQRGLLEAAYPFVKSGRASGIRISTRPDAIDREALELLAGYGVTAIELGAQSMDDDVLAANRRGHTAADVERACGLIHAHGGLALGLQMMVGLYGERDARRGAEQTARRFCALRPQTVRIYPTVVVENTPLYALWRRGDYAPLTVGQAVEITAALLGVFEQAGIRVIRIGLHADEGLRESAAAGPFHPAFGELCQARRLRDKIEAGLPRGAATFTVRVHPGWESRALGHKRANALYFAARGARMAVRADAAVPPGEVALQPNQQTTGKGETEFASEIPRDTGL